MRLELVLVGAGLAVVGALFVTSVEQLPRECSTFATMTWCSGGGTRTRWNPVGAAIALTGVALLVMGLVLRKPDVAVPARVLTPRARRAPAPQAAVRVAAPVVTTATHRPATASGAAVALTAGARILDGKYAVQRPLGQGTFGGTYLAQDLLLDRPVVLKELLPQWRDDPDVRARFEREAKVIAHIRHPNVVDLYGVERWGDGLLLVMEHVDGGSLAGALSDGRPMPLKDALAKTDQVLAALAAVHAEGVLHRDVKPSNVLVTRSGEVRLADFGIAHAPAYGTTMDARAPGSPHPGSLPFMSPEQARGDPLHAASDLYSVGATLYYLLVGTAYVPLSGKSREAQRRTILEEAPRLPVDGLPDEVNAFLAQALAKAPEDRFPSAEAMRAALPRVSS